KISPLRGSLVLSFTPKFIAHPTAVWPAQGICLRTIPSSKGRCEEIRHRKDWTRPLTPGTLSPWGRRESKPSNLSPRPGSGGARSDGGRGGSVRGSFEFFHAFRGGERTVPLGP